jgi:crotonobetainyl-CoA:carnitine CoA-transferase CaiB-like acyl-CoA transferase
MKLDGLRVVDLSVFLPGPYLTMSLADHGAEVIKVEMPHGGDPGREIGESDGPTTVFFRNVNRGKRSVTLDLKSEAGRAQLLALVDQADVFVEAFRPGVMARLGLDYATLSARNPRLVYCSISAFGQDGPYVSRPAHDIATEALAGVASICVGTDGTPAIPGIPVADIVSSLHALSGVLMALLRREKTGRGDLIDVSMHEAALAACPNVLGPVMAQNRQPIPKEERSLGGSAFYQVYETADGRHLVLGGQEIKFVKNLLDAFGGLEFLPLCARGPGLHQAPLIAFLRARFIAKPLAHWVEWFEGRDICFAPVNTLPEALDDAQVRARGAVQTDSLGRRHIAPVVRFLHEPAKPNWLEPGLGEGNAHLLKA